MKSNSPDQHQTNLYRPVLKQLINPRDALALLADKIPWKELKKDFEQYCFVAHYETRESVAVDCNY